MASLFTNECDFVVFHQKKPEGIYQICWQLNQNNLDREIAGLSEALDFFCVNGGKIITFNQADSFTIDNKKILAQPFYEWAETI